jgi:hypothetical protein
MKTTAIYGLFDPRKPKVIFYVGKGNAGRAACHWGIFLKRATATSGRLLRWFSSLQSAGVEAKWRFLEENVVGWEEREKFWIAHWREKNPQLCNVLDGGNEPPPIAGILGGRIGGRRTHELHPELAAENGRRTHELHPNHMSEIGLRGCHTLHRVKDRDGKSHHAKKMAQRGAVAGGLSTHKLHPKWLRKIGLRGCRVLHRVKDSDGKSSHAKKMGRLGGLKSGRRVNHIRWHVRRGLVNPNCSLCVARG